MSKVTIDANCKFCDGYPAAQVRTADGTHQEPIRLRIYLNDDDPAHAIVPYQIYRSNGAALLRVDSPLVRFVLATVVTRIVLRSPFESTIDLGDLDIPSEWSDGVRFPVSVARLPADPDSHGYAAYLEDGEDR